MSSSGNSATALVESRTLVATGGGDSDCAAPSSPLAIEPMLL
jgi:hypothetical protein